MSTFAEAEGGCRASGANNYDLLPEWEEERKAKRD
jgi:hypothetical protein